MWALRRWAVAAAVAVAAASGPAMAAEVVKEADYSLHLHGRLRLLGMTQYLDDASRSDARMYMFLEQARVGVDGEVSAIRYKLQLALGGEDEVKAPSPGIGLGLLDLYVDVPVGPAQSLAVRAGQFKTPYGRERLIDSGALLFADRSIADQAFRVGRDVGAILMGRFGLFKVDGGVLVGGGRDVPERYLPQRLGSPMFALRAGVDRGIGDEVQPAPAAEELPGLRYAVFANGLYVKDSLVGHSSVLNVRLGERSLLTHAAWNPYIAQSPMDRGELYQAGADAVVAAAAGPGLAALEAQLDTGRYSNRYGAVALTGARAQASYRYGGLTGAVRYAIVWPSSELKNAGKEITGALPMQEVTPGVTYTFFGGRLKLIADLPILIDAPVFHEPGVGAYLAVEHPEQASLLDRGTVTRQNVVEGRLQLQAQF